MEREEIIKQELIERNSLIVKKKNDFVEAGAGAGKTYSLITRIFHQLTRKDDPSNPKDIVAITFTNKAAEELRVRIVNRLKQVEADPLEEERLKERKEKLLREIDQMQISTIHKFCDNILRENAIQAGLSPDYQIIMDEDELLRRNNIVRKFFTNFGHNDWSKYAFLKDNRKVKARICECFEDFLTNVTHLREDQIYTCESINEDINSLVNDVNVAKGDIIAQVYEFYLNNESEILAKEKDSILKAEAEGKKLTSCFKKDYKSLFETFHKLKNIDEFAYIFEAIGITNPYNTTKLKSLKEDLDVINDYIKKYNEINDHIDLYFTKLFVKDAYRLYKFYLDEIKEDISHLTNNDLVYNTYSLLKNNEETRIKLQQKIKHLYIDEYQDTDSIQYQIASLIANNREDCLYLVGDPKQSIYRFRGAEPDVFFDTKKTFKDNEDTCDIYGLNINFRSNNEILKWVNEQYSKEGKNIRLVSDESYVYPEMLYADHNYIKEEDITNDKMIGFYSFDSSNPEDIAKLINYIKENKLIRRTIKTKDKDGKEIKTSIYDNVKYKDIMLMFEMHKKMPEYVDALTKENIPTRIFGRSDFSSSLALRTFVNLFDVISSNSNNNIALAESVFISLFPSKYQNKSEEEVHEISKDLIYKLRKSTKKMSAYGKAIYLIEHLELLLSEEYVAHSFELNNITSKLYQMVEEVLAKGYINGSELTKAFREYLDISVERESSIEKDVDAVMVINLHKAKGLEAPIVIWVNTAKADNGNASSTFYKGKFYHSELIKAVSKVDNTNTDLLSIKDEEQYEKARLEYVAVTRAGEAYVFCQGDAYNKGLFNNANRVYSHMNLPSIGYRVDEEKSGDTYEKSLKTYSPTSHEYTNGSLSKIDIKSPSSMENGVSLTRMKYKEEAGEIAPSERPSSNNVGTILHRALELLIKEGIKKSDAVNIAINENIDVVDDFDILFKFILTCLSSFEEFYKDKGYTNYQSYPEFAFSYLNKEKEIFNGSIDLLLVKDNEYLIIDYKSDEAEYIKSDDIFIKTLKEKYQPQLDMYEEVVRSLFNNIKVVNKKIVFFRRYQPDKPSIETLECDL